MPLAHHYTVEVRVSRPAISFMPGSAELDVYTVSGDYATVADALGDTGSTIRMQLDRFEATLREGAEAGHVQ